MNEADEVSQVAVSAAVVGVLLLAFSTDPFVRWLFPDPGDFVGYFGRLSRLHGERVGPLGGVFARSDDRGAALWYPPGVEPDGHALALLFDEAGISDRVLGVFEAAGEYEPSDAHWYLRQIGIDPLVQGAGLGGGLLGAALDLIDEADQLAYLEATSAPGLAFYERHGFRKLGEIRVGDAPPLWPMIREPQWSPILDSS